MPRVFGARPAATNRSLPSIAALALAVLDSNTNVLSGGTLYETHRGTQQYFNPFAHEVIQNCPGDIRILSGRDLSAALDHSHRRSEASQRLRELEPDVSSAQHDHVSRQVVEVQRFHVRHWLGNRKPRNVRYR